MFQSICEGFIEANLPDLIESILSGAAPYDICSSILGEENCSEPTTTPDPVTDPPTGKRLTTYKV